MKAIILAGGFGSRLSEETTLRPKPMVEIGGRPILWHIMNIFAAHNITEFIIALGYRGEVIKDYFLNFRAINNDVTIDLAAGKVKIHGATSQGGKSTSWTPASTPTPAGASSGWPIGSTMMNRSCSPTAMA